jgi:FtsZ-binding cell division protein ZapB
MSEEAGSASWVQEAAEDTPLPEESRQSLDTLLDRPVINGNNGTAEHEDANDIVAQDEAADEEPPMARDSDDRIAQLQEELEKVTNERDTFQSQYRGLLGKLSNMRTTLGDKLRQDAVSLGKHDVFPPKAKAKASLAKHTLHLYRKN